MKSIHFTRSFLYLLLIYFFNYPSTLYSCDAFTGPDESTCGFTYTLIGDPGNGTWGVYCDESDGLVNIADPNSSITDVTVTQCGFYQFIYTVVDAVNCVAHDTIEIEFRDPSEANYYINLDIQLEYDGVECHVGNEPSCEFINEVSIGGLNEPTFIWSFLQEGTCNSTIYTPNIIVGLGDSCSVDQIDIIPIDGNGNHIAFDMNTQSEVTGDFLSYFNGISDPFLETLFAACPLPITCPEDPTCFEEVQDTIVYYIPIREGGNWTYWQDNIQVDLMDQTDIEIDNETYVVTVAPSADYYGPGDITFSLFEYNSTGVLVPSYGEQLTLQWKENIIYDTVEVYRTRVIPICNLEPCGGVTIIYDGGNIPPPPPYPCGPITIHFGVKDPCEECIEVTAEIISSSPLNEINCYQYSIDLQGIGNSNNGPVDIAWDFFPNTGSSSGTNMTAYWGGIYTLIVTDINSGCTATDEIIIDECLWQPLVLAGDDKVITCSEPCVILDAFTDSPQFGNFYWIGPNGFYSNELNPQVCEPGTYEITVYNQCGCEDYDQVTITEDLVDPSIIANPIEDLTCEIPCTTLSVNANSANGYSITWFDSGGANIASGASHSVCTPGIYTAVVTDNFNGCTESVSLNVNESDNSVVNNISAQICQGEVYLINGIPYNQTGIFTEVIPNGSFQNCDSTIILDLTVNTSLDSMIAGTDTIVCGFTYTLVGQIPGGHWGIICQESADTVSFEQYTSDSVQVTVSACGYYQFYYELNNGACAGTNTMEILFLDPSYNIVDVTTFVEMEYEGGTCPTGGSSNCWDDPPNAISFSGGTEPTIKYNFSSTAEFSAYTYVSDYILEPGDSCVVDSVFFNIVNTSGSQSTSSEASQSETEAGFFDIIDNAISNLLTTILQQLPPSHPCPAPPPPPPPAFPEECTIEVSDTIFANIRVPDGGRWHIFAPDLIPLNDSTEVMIDNRNFLFILEPGAQNYGAGTATLLEEYTPNNFYYPSEPIDIFIEWVPKFKNKRVEKIVNYSIDTCTVESGIGCGGAIINSEVIISDPPGNDCGPIHLRFGGYPCPCGGEYVEINGQETFCEGGSAQLSASGFHSYAWSNGETSNSINVTEAGTYSLIVTNINGCSSENSFTVEEVENSITNIYEEICSGNEYILNGTSYFQEGNYTEELTNYLGCDSIINLELVVVEVPWNEFIPVQICHDDEFMINGFSFNQTGIYPEVITDYPILGCEFIIYWELTVFEPVVNNISTQICQGQEYIINGVPYNQSGVFTQVIPNGSWQYCDSTIVLDLNVNEQLSENLIGNDTTLCGFTYTFIGQPIGGNWGIICQESADSVSFLEVNAGSMQVTVNACGYYQFYYDLDDDDCGGRDTIEILFQDPSTLVIDLSSDIGVDYNEYGCPSGGSTGCSNPASNSISFAGATVPEFIWSFNNLAICESNIYKTIATIGNGDSCVVDNISIQINNTKDTISYITTESQEVVVNDFLSWTNNLNNNLLDSILGQCETPPTCPSSGPVPPECLTQVRDTNYIIIPIREGGLWNLKQGTNDYLPLSDSTEFSIQNRDYLFILSPGADYYGPESIDATIFQKISATNYQVPYDPVNIELQWIEEISYDTIVQIVDLMIDTCSMNLPCGGITINSGTSIGGTPTFDCGPLVLSFGGYPCPCEPFLVEINGNPFICAGGTVGLSAVVVGGSGPYSFSWNTGQTSSSAVANQSGVYSVEVTDDLGCSYIAYFDVSEEPNPIPTIEGELIICEGSSTTLSIGPHASHYWSNGSTNQSISVDTPGIYEVIVSNQYGCTGVDEVLVVQIDPPEATISGSLSFCNAGSTTLNAGDGFSNYMWSDNSTNQMISVNTEGIYSVTVSDVSGCTGVDQVSVIQSDQLEPTIMGSLNFCSGGLTTLDAGDGFGNYLWSNNSTTQEIIVTSEGEYSVTVEDVSGCTGTSLVNVFEAPDLQAEITSRDSIVCGFTYTLVGQPAGGTFSIVCHESADTVAFQEFTSDSVQVTVASCGYYQFIYELDNGICASQDSIEILFRDPSTTEFSSYIDIQLDYNDYGCHSGGNSGCLDNEPNVIVISGQIEPEFIWSFYMNGTCQSSIMESSIIGIGDSCVADQIIFNTIISSGNSISEVVESQDVVLDDFFGLLDGLHSDFFSDMLSQCPLPPLCPSPAPSPLECILTTVDTTFAYLPRRNGGLWNYLQNDTLLVPLSDSTIIDFNNQNYLFIIDPGADYYGTDPLTFTLFEELTASNYVLPNDPVELMLQWVENITYDTVMRVNVTSLDTCAIACGGVQMNAGNSLIPGPPTYECGPITLSFGGGGDVCACIDFLISTTIAPLDLGCEFCVEISGIGGSPNGAVDMYWEGLGGISAIVCESENYTFTVIDLATGCSTSETIFVNIQSPVCPPLFFDAGQNQMINCENPCTVLQPNFDDSFSFVWEGPGGFISNDLNPTVCEPGIYNLNIIGDCNCEYNNQVEIIEGDMTPPIANAGSNKTIDCQNDCVQLEGNIDADQNHNFSWTGPNGFISSELSPNVCDPGIYTLSVVEPSSGCEDVSEVTVTEEAIEIVSNLFEEICLGDCYTLGNMTYCQSGSYTSTLISWQGCDSIINLDLIVSELFIQIADVETITCNHSITIIDASASFGDNLNFFWTTSDGNILSDPSSLIIEVDQAGIYTLVIDNDICNEIQSVNVIDNLLPPTADAGTDLEINCQNNCVNLQGQASGNNISWSGPNGFSSSELQPEVCLSGLYILEVINEENGCIKKDSTIVIDGVISLSSEVNASICENDCYYMGAEQFCQPGIYNMTLTSSTGCDSIVNLSIEMTPTYIDIAAPEALDCNNEIVTLDANQSMSGSGVSYVWHSPDGNIIGNPNGATIQVDESGTYQLTLTNNGCINTANVTVVQNVDTLIADAGLDLFLDCNSQETTLEPVIEGLDNLAIEWSGPNGFNSQDLNPMVDNTGLYVLTLTHLISGCTAADVVKVEADAPIIFEIDPGISCEETATGSLTIGNISEGLAPYQYALDDQIFQDNPDFEMVAAGEHTVYVMDDLGCIQSQEMTLTNYDPIQINLEEMYQTCADEGILLSAIDSNQIHAGTLTYLWSDGSTNAVRPFILSGDYWVEVSNDCETVHHDFTIINEFVPLTDFLYIPNAFSPNGDSNNDEFKVAAAVPVVEFEILVFDRWGNNVFGSKDVHKGWNGKLKGRNTRIGVYVWWLRAKFETCNGGEEELFLEGDVTLLR